MKLIKKYLEKNDCYKKGTKMQIKGIMLHSVGCACEKAQNFINSWNKKGVEVCVHAFVEENGNVYQTLPFDMIAWHAGRGKNGSANNGYISIEMCEPKNIIYSSKGIEKITDLNYTKDFVYKTYFTSVVFVAGLCQKYNLDPLKHATLISHSEGYKLGIASNHGDVEHLWKLFGLTMDQFRIDVKKLMKDNNLQKNLEYKKEDETMKKVIPVIKEIKDIKINNNIQKIECLFHNNYNYIKLQELRKLGIKIDYDIENKMPILNG